MGPCHAHLLTEASVEGTSVASGVLFSVPAAHADIWSLRATASAEEPGLEGKLGSHTAWP